MADGKWNVAWAEVLVAALLSVAGTIFVFHYTGEAPDLVYEVFPPAHFTSQAAEISIYNVRVQNAGNKEVSNVQVYLALPDANLIEDVKVEPNFSTIDYKIHRAQGTDNAAEVRFPLLNAGESAQFSLLVTRGKAAGLTVQVRGNGAVGRPKENGESTLGRVNNILVPVAIILVIVATLITVFEKFGQLQRFLQSYFAEQLRATRTQTPGAVSKLDLAHLLTSKTWRLFFNPKVPGLSKTKLMRFGPNGVIVEGKNANEATWRVQGNLLELVNDQGGVHSRFYYGPVDQRFYHTNDPELGSITKHGIRDQYLIPEEIVPRPA